MQRSAALCLETALAAALRFALVALIAFGAFAALLAAAGMNPLKAYLDTIALRVRQRLRIFRTAGADDPIAADRARGRVAEPAWA